MRYAQILIHENDGRLTAMLQAELEAKRCLLRQPRDLAECLQLLAQGWPAVLVLRLGRDLEGELTMLTRVKHLHPEAGCVVVGDSIHAAVAGLAWDLGADYVLLLPQPKEMLPLVVAGLLGLDGGHEGP
jgi:DNA-binding NtrC family response regulator